MLQSISFFTYIARIALQHQIKNVIIFEKKSFYRKTKDTHSVYTTPSGSL